MIEVKGMQGQKVKVAEVTKRQNHEMTKIVIFGDELRSKKSIVLKYTHNISMPL